MLLPVHGLAVKGRGNIMGNARARWQVMKDARRYGGRSIAMYGRCGTQDIVLPRDGGGPEEMPRA